MSHAQLERFPLRSPRRLADFGIDSPAAGQELEVRGFARLGHGEAGDLCFCDRDPGNALQVPDGALVLCTEELAASLGQSFPRAVWLPVQDPRAAFIDLGHDLSLRDQVQVTTAVPRPFGIHPLASVGAQTFVHPEARIDEGAVIGALCVIHRGTWIQAGAVVRDHAVIGVDGINAYRGADGRQRRFPHFASAIVEEGAEIGACAVVVRGIVNSTRIGRGSVVGNLCNIGHGVEIGEKVWMSVGCLIGGHTRIGSGATLGMGVRVKDNIEIGARAQVGMGSVAVKAVAADASVFGNPARFMGSIQAGPAR